MQWLFSSNRSQLTCLIIVWILTLLYKWRLHKTNVSTKRTYLYAEQVTGSRHYVCYNCEYINYFDLRAKVLWNKRFFPVDAVHDEAQSSTHSYEKMQEAECQQNRQWLSEMVGSSKHWEKAESFVYRETAPTYDKPQKWPLNFLFTTSVD